MLTNSPELNLKYSSVLLNIRGYPLKSIVLLIVGYILLGTGPVDSDVSWKVAPFILVGVYVFLLPLSVLLKK